MSMTAEQIDKCLEIAGALDGQFQLSGAWGEFVLAGGEEIFVRIDKGRLHVSGSWPRSKKNEVFYPHTYEDTKYQPITVDFSRPVEAIAGNIKRRFLPGFIPEWAKQTKRCADSNQYENDTKDNLSRLAKLVDAKPSQHQTNEFSLYGMDVYGHVRISGTSVQIELRSLTVEQAEAVLKVVKGF